MGRTALNGRVRGLLALATAACVVVVAFADGAAAAATAAAAAAAPPSSTTTTKTIPLSGWRALSICAPVSVLISDAPDGKTFDAVVSGPAGAVDALAFNPTRQSMQVETRGAGFAVASPLTVELRLPPGILSSVERIHAPGDTVIAATWNPHQAEVSSSAQAGVILSAGMGSAGEGASAKVSLAGPGPAVVAGAASRWEVFAGAAGGVVHVQGPTRHVSVKVDGGAAVTVAPAAGNVTVAGRVGAVPGTSLSLGGGLGDCQAQADAWAPPPGSPPGAPSPPACGTGSAAPPALSPAWVCGVEVVGEWGCGGGGVGPVPAVVAREDGSACGSGREMRASAAAEAEPATAVAEAQEAAIAAAAAAAAAAAPSSQVATATAGEG